MGYRLRLGKVSKSDWENIYKYKSKEEIIENWWDEDEDFSFAYPPEHIQLYELGKHVDFVNEEFTPFYSFELDGNDFWIVSKKGLLSIIDKYHESTNNYYQELMRLFNDKDDKFERRISNHLLSKTNEWGKPYGRRPYYLDQENTDGFISGSWDIEYAIFNLVYIYRTFDFEKDLLIYSGW
jgi:hypothetical protein